ncbi:nitrate ABC transporter substrate-binding protein [Actinoplanes lobatus]|uniref:Thiamine pyrimidine synthase n=1 Tax=Actinoplanes lobatus TaxID=113568 RepID=A0A7W7MLX1_9ACTN|nr:ABC transporter substrate-binding protein [Actinoplanes lobatus]MBB4754756.1 NitT/TauT family transport system substrate-binding protein [Actinoplanes lobatus]GGN81919.1 nitrate ABC transporter substrate-binding protein [Actinoplanes lobatus]GIE43112.1 nitrate ABC transporter substrate-binding protein [Actinoplanes lobatus]
MKLSRIFLASVLALTACGTADTATTPAPGASGALTPITLQLQWFYQAQFAGYIAAVDQGFYKEQGLDVTLLEGGVDIVPQTVLAQGKADYAIAWVPKALASREQGAGITDVGQIFARSGTYQVAWKDSGITKAADLKGKKVGNWGFGNEFELFAGMTKAGIDPGRDVTLVQQQFDMQALLKKEIDAAQAMSYNEYAQLLEAKNPATGKLYTADDFAVIDWKTEGSSMLQDAVWANTQKLDDPAYQQQTVKFLTATIKGWAFCRDNPEKCRDLVVAKGSKLGKSHQLWQMNEVSKLVWPAAAGGIGTIDEAAWKQTVEISQTTKNQTGDSVLTKAPEGLAYTNDYIKQAIEQAKAAGVDVEGAGFQPATVTLTEGGA